MRSLEIQRSGMVIAKLVAGGFKEQTDEKINGHCYLLIHYHDERDTLGCSAS